MKDYLSTNQAATALGITPDAVRMAIRAGKLDATKRGRDWWITRAEVDRYARGRRQSEARRAAYLARLGFTGDASAVEWIDIPASLLGMKS